jgi:thiamine-monophosphate kinase
MKLSQVGEFALIKGIKELMEGHYPGQVIMGIGDDCAILRPSRGVDLIITTDTLAENIHFNTQWMSYYQVGWRALAANLSDIAAMAGTPLGALLACSLPAKHTKEEFDLLLQGINDLGRRYKCPLIGGDITRSEQDLFINMTVIGRVEQGKGLCRNSARVGDEVWVTGWLGNSRAGLEYFRHQSRLKRKLIQPAIERFLQPLPRLEEALYLAQKGRINSMIDISDGLSSDLRHICQNSKVGAEIYSYLLPIADSTRILAQKWHVSPYDWALHGGEDFELCFTAEEASIDPLVKDFKERFHLPLSKIGRIVQGKEIILVEEDGEKYPLKSKGYNHFQ